MKCIRRKKIVHQLNLGVILWLVSFASLLCGAGIGISMLKNNQINVQREIENMRVEINSCEKTKEHYEYKMSSTMSRWAVRDRLAQNNSLLKEIEPDKVEFIRRSNTASQMAANH